MGVINYNIEEGRRVNQREGVSFLGEKKGGKEEGESTHTHYLSSYSNLLAKANSSKVTSCLFSCFSDAMGVFILEYALLYAMGKFLNKKPLLQA